MAKDGEQSELIGRRIGVDRQDQQRDRQHGNDRAERIARRTIWKHQELTEATTESLRDQQ
jgi:hypothetical protein